MPRRDYHVTVLVLVCIAFAVVVGCQVHALSTAYEQTAPTDHRHAAPSHASAEWSCLAAVLPTMMFLPYLLLTLFYATLRLFPSMLYTLLPFIPPRVTAS